MRNAKAFYNILVESRKGRDHSEDIGVLAQYSNGSSGTGVGRGA
jgi:hypothetical protein